MKRLFYLLVATVIELPAQTSVPRHTQNTHAMTPYTQDAILILDIQDDFTKPHGKYPVDARQADEMIQRINDLLRRKANGEATIIYIGNEFSAFNPLNIFRNFAALKGGKGAKMDERLTVASEHYFAKNWDNAFTNPALDAFLKQRQITRVFISGVKAEACVRATARGAMKRGYHTTILTDCIATASDKKRNRIIRQYIRAGIRTSTSSDLN